jgi:hypothetical protein
MNILANVGRPGWVLKFPAISFITVNIQKKRIKFYYLMSHAIYLKCAQWIFTVGL